MSFPAQALLDPGSMLASLHQHAVKAGLTIPTESVERLQEGLPVESVNDGGHGRLFFGRLSAEAES